MIIESSGQAVSARRVVPVQPAFILAPLFCDYSQMYTGEER
jgi:hypothetical protein